MTKKDIVWKLTESDSLDKDYSDIVTLTNDKFTETIRAKANKGDESFSISKTRVLDDPWKRAGSMDGNCKAKFTVVTDVKSNGKTASLERGMCVGIEKGKPVLYKYFRRSDYADPNAKLDKAKNKNDKQNLFELTSSLMILGDMNLRPGDVTFKNKTNYKKLLGLD